MIKTLSPYSTTSKTAEIMSRYRPIAPKPEPPAGGEGEQGQSVMSSKIRQSPFMRNIWPQLQARPTRTRKRGRTSTLAPPVFKRQRSTHQLPQLLAFSPSKTLSLHGFVHPAQAQVRGLSRLAVPSLAPGCNLEDEAASIVTLPLLPCQPAAVTEVEYPKPFADQGVIDLNTTLATPHVVPEEKDLLQQLQRPTTPTPTSSNVIAPQPVRPVGSVIRVERINNITTEELAKSGPKTRGEVEQEVESEPLPVVISDSHNKVRMANSAYKEMVGQPECSWLDRMVAGDSDRVLGGKRIGGEVMLQLSDSDFKVPVSATSFSCWAKIEWGHEGNKSCVNAFCDVIRVACESKDFELAWRIRTRNREPASPLSSTA